MPSRRPSCRFCGKYVTRSDTRARAKRFAFACGSFARNGLIGVRAPVDAPGGAWRGAAAAELGAGIGAAWALLGIAACCATAPLSRGGAMELGGAAPLPAVGCGSLGATSGREEAAAAAAPAPPGIIGRGGKSNGRPAGGGTLAGGAAFAGAGVAATGCDVAFAVTLFSSAGAQERCGCCGTISLVLGGGDEATGGGAANVSINAVVRPAFPRPPLPCSTCVRKPTCGAAEFDENSSSMDAPAVTVMTPPHTEQRARTVVAGTLAGSTRKTERHSGQETFTCPPLR